MNREDPAHFLRFQMVDWMRDEILANHGFYVEQVRTRLLSQFNNDKMETEAEAAARAWWTEQGPYYDAARDDLDSLRMRAGEKRDEFYQLLDELRKQTLLSVTAGMFHAWDKQLRDWLVSEMRHWPFDENVLQKASKKVWQANVCQIGDLLDGVFGDIQNQEYFRQLDACRLVVNTYKHGEGTSFDELKTKYPQYLERPIRSSTGKDYRNHTALVVSEDQFDEFSDAIFTFWKSIPYEAWASEARRLPKWFGKEFENEN